MKRRTCGLTIAILAVTATMFSGPVRGQDAGPRIKVLTLNVWGIIGAKERAVRAEAIGRKIAALDPDIIALEEAFEQRHRDILLKSLVQNGYQIEDWRCFRHIYGSGILFISKFKIEKVIFEPYRVIGGAADIEWLGGKGIAYLRLSTPWGPLDFFHTHAIARMTPIFDAEGNYLPGDPKQTDRLLHMYQIDRFVRSHRNPLGRSMIAAGDFNVSPEMLEYHFLVRLTGFENSFDLINPGQNPSTFSVQNIFVTDDYSRIDHIFFKNYDGTMGFWLQPVASRLEMTDQFTNPENMKELNYSDHYGLITEFEVAQDEGGGGLSPEGVIPPCCPCRSCSVEGYDSGVIELTPSNSGDWQRMALAEFRRSLWKQERKNRLLIPMARVVAADPGAAVKVEIPPELRAGFERNCGCLSPEG